jgi:hypothetical protein
MLEIEAIVKYGLNYPRLLEKEGRIEMLENEARASESRER